MNRSATFDDLHRMRDDPWEVDASWYERRKRDLTLAALPRERYTRGFEPGCSIGALSERLAERCDTLVVADVSRAALERARARLAPLPHVEVVELEIPAAWPGGELDLIVLSEVAYFLSGEELEALARAAAGSLAAGGDLVLVNWRGPIDGFFGLDGDAVHERFRQLDGLERVCAYSEPDFLIDTFRR